MLLLMKKLIVLFAYPVRLLFFWLLFFAAFRLWFVLWFSAKWSAQSGGRVWAAFWHALPLDLSTAGYLLALPVLLGPFLVSKTAGENRVARLLFWFNVLLIIVLVFVFGANVFLYEEWQTLLNNRAIAYMRSPGALLDSMSGVFKLGTASLYFGSIWFWVKMHRDIIGSSPQASSHAPYPYQKWLAWPLQLGLLALCIRGGTGVMPINESAVYYSGHLFDNHAATNTAWHLLHSMIETRTERNPFIFNEKAKAEATVARLFEKPKTTAKPQILGTAATAKPNVVCIIMESMTAQVVAELGGEPGVCPTLGRLAREGVLFENVFGSGYRTDQGLVSILSGYPAQPDQSVVLLEDKSAKLPSVPRVLRQNGYATAYFYGGELMFANIGVYLANQGYAKILSEKDFPDADKTQRWGVDDDRLLQRAAAEIGQLPEPFFATAMTLSLHPPYDVPFTSQWSGNQSERNKFLNTAAFADHAIGRFFERVRSEAWFKNTLFVLVADHGSSQPGAVGMEKGASRRVPLIVFGEPMAAAWRGKRLPVFGNHHDIPATVLAALGHEVSGFRFSRDLFSANPAGSFAYFTNENGLGWATPSGEAFFSFESKNWETNTGQLDSATRQAAQAYLQVLYDDFLGL